MEHRKRNRMQHKVELSLVLKMLMTGRRNRKVRMLVDREGRMYNEFSRTGERHIAKMKTFDTFY